MRPSDAHWNLIGERSYRVAQAAIEAFQRHAVKFVTAGGWAVYTYDASTPSVDFDAFVQGGVFPRPVEEELVQAGYRVGAQKEIEALALDGPQEVLGTGDPDLGIPSAQYVPAELFRNRTETRELRFGPRSFQVPVPSREALAITKLAALRGRTIGYALHEDAAVLALLDPSTANMMRAAGQSYYLRKAGKDLFDVSLLLKTDDDLVRCRRLGQEFGIWGALIERLPLTSRAIRDTAADLARRAQIRDPTRILELR